MANPRFFGKKDLDTFDRVNKELIGDLNNANSGIIDQTVIVYKYQHLTQKQICMVNHQVERFINLVLN